MEHKEERDVDVLRGGGGEDRYANDRRACALYQVASKRRAAPGLVPLATLRRLPHTELVKKAIEHLNRAARPPVVRLLLPILSAVTRRTARREQHYNESGTPSRNIA